MAEGIDWEPIRIDLGFGSMKEMWETLYDEDNHKTNSLNKMAKYLGVCTKTILDQLRAHKVKMRPKSTHAPKRKGHFNPGTRRLLARREVLKDLTVKQIVERFGLKDANQFYCIARWHGLEWKRRKSA